MLSIRRSVFVLGFVTVLVSMAVVIVGVAPVPAALQTWDNDSDGGDGSNTDFNNPANWIVGQIGGVVPGSDDNATFVGAAVSNPNLSGSVTLQGITFAPGSSGFVLSASPTFSYTLTNTGTGASSAINAANSSLSNTVSGPIILGGDAATTATFSQSAGGTLVLSGNISSTNAITGLSLASGGIYTLSGTNSYSGTTTLNGATLNLNSNAALGAGNLVISNAGAILDNTSGSLKTLSNGVSASTAFNFAGTNDLTFNGGLTFTAAGTRTISAGRLTFNGGVNWGAFRTIKNGAGTLVLNGPGTGTGQSIGVGGTAVPYVQTARIDAGFIEVGHNDAFSTGVVEIRTGGGLSANTPVTLPNAFNLSTLNAVFGGSNNMTFNGNFVISNGASGNVNTLFVTNTAYTLVNGSLSLTDLTGDNQTLTIDVASTSGGAEFSGAIQNTTTGTATGTITKAGGGLLVLSGASTYTGQTNVQNGTLQLTGSLPTGAILNLGNGTDSGKFILGSTAAAKNQTVNRILTTGSGTANAIVGGNAAVSTLTVNGTTSTTFAGSLGGAGTNENNLALTKAGSHTLTLSGNSTYTGATSISAGTLSVTGSLNGTSGTTISGTGTLSLSGTGSVDTGSIAVNGTADTARFLHIGTVPSTRPVSVSRGTVDGTGSVGDVTVAASGTGVRGVANGNGTSAALTLNSLTYLGGGVANVRTNQASPLQPGLVVTNTLTTTMANPTTINLTSDTGFWNSGLYNLIGYGSFNGSISDFTVGTIAGLSTRQSNGGLSLNGNNVAIQIVGDAPKWTGKDDNNWAVGLVGAMKNWELITADTPTDYLDQDTVLFDDTATGSTAIDLGSNVAPGAATFNNSAKSYSLSSAGNFGITAGQLIKSNNGSLTINTTNTYAGGTSFTGGTLNIGAAGALGAAASRLTIGPGSSKTLDNTSGSALALATNIPQTWNDDFTFLGSNDGTHDLNMGTGTVTLSGATRTVTVANGLLSIGAISSGTTTLGVEGAGALAIPSSTLVGLTGSGNLESKAGATTTVTMDMASDTTFSGSFRNSTLDGATLALTKTGIGKLTLTGASFHTGNTTITNGTLSVQNPLALGSGLIVLGGTSTGTLDIALNEFDDVANLWQKGSGTGVVTLASGRATPGPGVNHNLSTSVIGSGTINVIAGSNVTSGTATLTINDVNITTGGTGGTTTFNPTTANLILPDVDNGGTSGGTAVRILDLGGTTTGNILGNMTWQSGTSLGLAKTNTSTWTITGTGNYNGAIVVSGGVLNVGDGGTIGSLGTGAITNNATLNFNRSDALTVNNAIGGTMGSINQIGTGTTTLTGISTYSGATNINGGELVVNGSLANSALALNSGTLDGTGTVGDVTVADNATNVVANGDGGIGDLTIGSLTFAGDATVNVRTSSPGLVVTGALTTNAVNGTVTINPTTATGTWANGPNNLISFGSMVGSLSDYSLGTITGTLGPRQSYGSLLLNGNNIALQVVGDDPKWTGAANNQWTTGVVPNPKNWKLIAGGTNVDYLEGDRVTFDDSAVGTTVDISSANVSPAGVEFNNSAVNYTIGSSGGFGIAGSASILKNGTGTVVISSNNTYSGTTTVNGGTLTLSGSNTSSAAATVNPGGTLRLDFSASTAPATDILSSGSSLALGGAKLQVVGKANTNNSQSVASLHANAGGSTIDLTADPSANPVVLHLGAITRSTGASVIFTLPAGGQDFSNGVTTTNTNFNGLLGPGGIISSPGMASVNSPDGYTFATVSGGNIVPYTFATPATTDGSGFAWGGIPSGGDGTINYDVNATVPANIGAARNVNSIRYVGTGITQTGTATLTINGFMNAGTGPVTISQPVAVGVTQDLTLAAASAPINVTTAISNNGLGASAITLTGPNTVTLTGTNLYTGSTNVNGGTLMVTGSGFIELTSGININGNGAKFLYTSTTPSARPIALTQGTLDGTSSVGAVTVGDNPANLVTNGNGTSAALSISSLSFDGAGRVEARVNTGTPTSAPITALALEANGAAGSVKVDVTPHGAWSYNTTYSLVSYGGGSIGGTGFSAFTLGDVSGLSSRTTATLGNTGNAITLAIGASGTVVWTGLDNSNWVVGPTGANKNWKLQSDNSATDFISNDDVVFDDTGINTSLNISGAPVNVSFATFNNASVPYTINGSGIASGGIAKNGAGSLTINTANTYSLGTTFNGGTLNIGNAGALGSGLVTVGTGSAKTLNNTSGGPLTLTSNVVQNWNDDFAFTGSSDLNMGTGLVTLAGAGPTRTVNVAGGALQVGSIRSATLSGVGLTKSGAGMLVSDGDAPNVIEGDLNVNGGTLSFVDQTLSVSGNLNVNSGAFSLGVPGLTVAGDINVGGGASAAIGSNTNTTGLAGSGTISNGTVTNGNLIVNNSVDKTFSGVMEDGVGGGILALTKQGTGTLTLAGDSTRTGITAIQAGKLVMSHGNALGVVAPATLLQFTSGATFEIATDNIGDTDTAYQMTMGSGSTVNIISNRATPGPGISHPMSTSADPLAATLGVGTINFTSGSNVTSGMGNISFDRLNSSAGTAGSIILNPTTATVTIGTATKQSAGTTALTFEFGGTTTGNAVTGAISDGVAAVVSVAKSNTSTWTLSGESTYTGGTTVTGGTLLVNNTMGSGTGTGAVTVTGGTLGGTGIINTSPTNSLVTIGTGGSLAPGNSGAGTMTFELGTGTLTLGTVNTGRLMFDLGAPAMPSASDAVVINSGILALGTLTFADFTFTDIGMGPGTYKLFDAPNLPGSITGSIPVGTATGTIGSFTGTLSLDATNFDVLLSVTAGIPGDYNNDGKVNAADYVLWRKNPGAFGGPGGYDTWRANFGNPPGAGSSSPDGGGAVPEPGAFALLCLSGLALAAIRRVRD